MISEEKARTIALVSLERRSRGFTFVFVPSEQKRSDDWTMVFDCVTEGGSVLDGPILILVSKQTGRARTLEEDIEQRFSGR